MSAFLNDSAKESLCSTKNFKYSLFLTASSTFFPKSVEKSILKSNRLSIPILLPTFSSLSNFSFNSSILSSPVISSSLPPMTNPAVCWVLFLELPNATDCEISLSSDFSTDCFLPVSVSSISSSVLFLSDSFSA